MTLGLHGLYSACPVSAANFLPLQQPTVRRKQHEIAISGSTVATGTAHATNTEQHAPFLACGA